MNRHRLRNRRRGAITAMLGIVLVVILTLVALAIDLGMVAVARSQSQNAADAAAIAGARSISGNSTDGYNLAAVPKTAFTAAAANKILGAAVDADPKNITTVNAYTSTSKKTTIEIGTYAFYYSDDAANTSGVEGFKIEVPRKSESEPYSLVRATVQGTGNYGFTRAIGLTSFTVQAKATAAHRPRDVMVIMDLSGSMRFQSVAGTAMSGIYASPSTSSPRTQSMNPDPNFPKFGTYSDVTGAKIQYTGSGLQTSSREFVDPCNQTVTSTSGPPIVDYFYKNAINVTPTASDKAFTASSAGYNIAPGGDNYLKIKSDTGATYANYVKDLNDPAGTTTIPAFERKGFLAYRGSFKAYTEGPGYWGKTFFVWPPSPPGPNVKAPPSIATDTAYAWYDNGSQDWRQRFFVAVNTSDSSVAWLSHNNILFSTTAPFIKSPATSTTVTENGVSKTYRYRVNYAAVLYWLQQSPVHFPSTLSGGRIRYYTAIPSGTDNTLNNRWWTTAPNKLANNERFWKAYIDFTLGLTYDGSLTNVWGGDPVSSMVGGGDWFTASGTTLKSSARPQPQPPINNPAGGYMTLKPSVAVAMSGTAITFAAVTFTPVVNRDFLMVAGDTTNYYKITAYDAATKKVTISPGLKAAITTSTNLTFHSPYMDYSDRPAAPRSQFWFGAATMIDWLGNYTYGDADANPHHWWPANVPEAQGWVCKVGIAAAIDDIRTNHPSDFIGLTFFSNPKTSAGGGGYHNRAVTPLGRDYTKLKDSLWYPPSTVTGTAKEISPYDSDMSQVPRANGATGPGMGFLIAYNHFSASTSLRSYATPQPQYRGDAGGLGRKGANRLIIFETDGAPNTRAHASLAGSGASSYYPIRIKNPTNLSDTANVEWPTGGTYADTEVVSTAKQICKLTTDSPPGYSTSRKPVEIHCIGFGTLFDPANASSGQTAALQFFVDIENESLANIKGASKYGSTGSFPTYKLVYGTVDQRITKLTTAFSKIMQSGVQISLLE